MNHKKGKENEEDVGQLKKDLPGITNTMLTKGLRELEDDGLITRK